MECTNRSFAFKDLYDVAEKVKATKESLRLQTLLQYLESVHDNLQENVTCLPLKPSLEVNGIQVKTCSYFPSNTLPLKISFQTAEKNIIPAIFKVCLVFKIFFLMFHLLMELEVNLALYLRLEMTCNRIC